MNRKKGVKRGKGKRERKTGMIKLFIACVALCQRIRVPLRPHGGAISNKRAHPGYCQPRLIVTIFDWLPWQRLINRCSHSAYLLHSLPGIIFRACDTEKAATLRANDAC